ncbi:MAG: LysR substrate-binding domain-containing protein [Collimonas sp.]|uniref:LysR substrate-binding domain-containing protein n=1 Tax=Collimonas sp. TaxID=1963772 RepID=UPI003265A277
MRKSSVAAFGPERVSQLTGAADDLMLLVEVIEAGGFSAASARTGVPKSRLSRRIAALEEQLGVHLLLRNSRYFEVTEIGRQLYEHGRSIRSETYAAMTLAHNSQEEAHGSLHIACPIALASVIVGRVATEFALAHPRVRLCLSSTMGTVESLTKHFDLVLLPSAQSLPDSDMIVQRLAFAPYLLVATPAVIESAGCPAEPDALSGVDAIGWGSAEESSRWHLIGPQKEHAEVETRIRFSSDNLLVIRQAALAGLGVARMSDVLCRQDIAEGRLSVVLPGWAPPPMSIYALYASRRHISIAGKLFLSELVKQFDQMFSA